MSANYFAFGEILWDCLPSGRHAGGAPFNVAAHLAQLGANVALISAVGRDALGDEILQVARDKRVDTSFIERARIGLPTGTVLVTLDTNSNATYELVQPVAWDEIRFSPRALAAVAEARAFVFGSLACRSPYNHEQLRRLLEVKGPMRFFDVNLRPPFVDPQMVLDLAKQADVIKLNDDELGLLSAFAQGEPKGETPRTEESLAAACDVVARATAVPRICVTRGSAGAALWDGERLITAPAPQISVKDTVGAGDAFMAGLIMGLTTGQVIQDVLTAACRLGAYVASHHGATPLLPNELTAALRAG